MMDPKKVMGKNFRAAKRQMSDRVQNLRASVCCNFIVRTKAALKVHVKLEQNGWRCLIGWDGARSG